MRRRAPVIVLGAFAIGAAAYGIGCSSDEVQPASDAGADHVTTNPTDTGAPTLTCNGDLPVMTVRANGQQIAPDWSCYPADAGVLAPITRIPGVAFDVDAGDDGGDAGDAGDAADAETDAADAVAPVDSGSDTGTDAGADSGGGDAGTYELALIEFVSHQAVPNASVEIYFGSSTAGTPDRTGTSDSAGMVPFAAPPGGGIGKLSYHATGAGLSPLRLYDVPTAPPPFKSPGYSITTTNTNALVTSILGGEPERTDASIVVASLRDCQDRDVQGAQIALIDEATGQPVASSAALGGARTVYFNDTGLPDPRCTFTVNGSQAIWTMLNAPVNMPGNTHPYSVRVQGRVTAADTAPRILNQTKVELFAGESTVPRPYRTTLPQ